MNMRPRPDLDPATFISGAPSDSTASPDRHAEGQILEISVDKLRPNNMQDRDDFESEESVSYIDSLAASFNLDLPGGKKFGVRNPLFVGPADAEGIHEIIAGENRWRAAKQAKLLHVPCIIRNGSATVARLEHVSENALRRDLTLWQQAKAVQRDQEEFKLSDEQIITAHGLRNKSQLSKIRAVLKMTPLQQDFFITGLIDNVSYAYDLKKITDESSLRKLEKMLRSGKGFRESLDKILRHKAKAGQKGGDEGGEGGEGGEGSQGGQGGQGGDGAPFGITLNIDIPAAIKLAKMLDIEVIEDVNSDNIHTFVKSLSDRINGMAV